MSNLIPPYPQYTQGTSRHAAFDGIREDARNNYRIDKAQGEALLSIEGRLGSLRSELQNRMSENNSLKSALDKILLGSGIGRSAGDLLWNTSLQNQVAEEIRKKISGSDKVVNLEREIADGKSNISIQEDIFQAKKQELANKEVAYQELQKAYDGVIVGANKEVIPMDKAAQRIVEMQMKIEELEGKLAIYEERSDL